MYRYKLKIDGTFNIRKTELNSFKHTIPRTDLVFNWRCV